MYKLFATIGLPRSSKSTQCKKWLHYNNYIKDGKFQEYISTKKDKDGWFIEPELRIKHIENERRVLVSGDEIRQALYGSNWNSLCEDYVDSIKYTMVRALLNSGHTVLIDETNTSERSIQKILEIDIDTEFAFVETKPEICHRRADENVGPYCKSLLHKPIDRMVENLKTLAFQYSWVDCWDTPEWLNRQDIQLIIKEIREGLVRHKEIFTNEPIRENSKLPEVSALPKHPCSTFTSTGSLSPDQPTYQVWRETNFYSHR